MRRHLLTLATSILFLGASGAVIHESISYAAERADAGSARPSARPTPPAPPVVPAPRLSREEAKMSRMELTVGMLADHVAEQSHPDALRFAVRAYLNYRDENPGQVRKPYLYFVDYGLDNRTPRGYVFDMDRMALVDGPFHVAHGRGSGARDGIPTRFSNRPGSNATSLGLYLAQETYSFSGTSNGRFYRSTGLRLRGLSGRFNSTARERGVVVHGAPYVTEGAAGRSEGCPAMEQDRAYRLIPQIANGGLVYLFSPEDPSWLREEPWANASGPRMASSAR